MTTEDNTSEHTSSHQKPLGYWLRTVDALLTQEFATAFDGNGASRRDWMILNVLSGDVDAPGFAERLARKGKRLSGLAERGWVEQQGDGTWAITDEGRAAQASLGEIVAGIRARVAGAVSPEDYATTMASLEAIARELGWDENSPRVGRGFGPRPFGPFGRGRFGGAPFDADRFGPNLHHGFRPGFGPGSDADGAPCGRGEHGHGDDRGRGHGDHGHRGFGPGEHGFGPGAHGHGRHGHKGHRGEHRGAERAYERGFDAGFARGNAATAASDAV